MRIYIVCAGHYHEEVPVFATEDVAEAQRHANASDGAYIVPLVVGQRVQWDEVLWKKQDGTWDVSWRLRDGSPLD